MRFPAQMSATLAALALFACAPEAASPAPPVDPDAPSVTPAELKAMIEADGAQATVNSIYQNGTDPRINSVFQGIESGEQAWLAVVPAFRQGVDGETGYSLNYALSIALTENPAGTLRLVSEAIPVTELCTYAQIEPTPEEKFAYYATATTAVTGVTDPELETVKSACLAQLAKAE